MLLFLENAAKVKFKTDTPLTKYRKRRQTCEWMK